MQYRKKRKGFLPGVARGCPLKKSETQITLYGSISSINDLKKKKENHGMYY